MSGLLNILEGIDGAGKSTLADCLAERYSISLTSPKDVAKDHHPYIQDVMSGISRVIWPAEELKAHAGEFPVGFWLHIQATWYHLHNQGIALRHANGERMISDGWWYKFFAKLVLQGYDSEFLTQCFEHSLKPDRVLFVDVDPEVVWDRRTSFSGYEMGALNKMRDEEEIGKQSFIQFQSKIRNELRKLADEKGWVTLYVPKDWNIEETVTAAAAVLELQGDSGDGHGEC